MHLLIEFLHLFLALYFLRMLNIRGVIIYLPKMATFVGASSTAGFSTNPFTLYTLSSICNPLTIPYLLTSFSGYCLHT